MLQVCFHSFFHLKLVTLEEKGGGKYTEGTSGRVDGVRVESCVSWTTARIHPSTAGSWQKEYVLTKSKRNILQEACQCDQKGFRWKLQREKAKSPSKSIKAGSCSTAQTISQLWTAKEMTLADSGKRGGRALGAAEMLMECTGELGSELEKQAQPQTGVLGLSGASVGNKKGCLAASEAAALSSAGDCSGQGMRCWGQQSARLPTSVQGHRGNGHGFPFHGDCTMTEACHKGTWSCKKEGAMEFGH